jgi:hypothetical protein
MAKPICLSPLQEFDHGHQFGTHLYVLAIFSASKISPHLARKLVRRPQDWPWSSYLFYEKGDAGLITIDPV